MNRYISFMALVVVLMFAVSNDVLADEPNAAVSMTITTLHVNDQTLELTYKIKNDSDHDIWICDSVNIKSNRLDYEAYVAKDAQTLVIRKRFDLPGGNVVLDGDFTGRYVRLRPGQERADSLLVTLPPMTNRFFDAEIGKAKYTKRLALEIGYYDEDLRSLILDTVEIADKLDCDTSTLSYEYHEIYTRYFPGLLLELEFNDRLSSQFRDSINSEGDEILMPPLSWVGIHLGEKVLQLTVDGVYIRCWGEPPLSETLPAGVTMALTGFEVNDTNLKMGFKIINNTDHDVWICDGLTTGYFECVLDKDNETLKIIKRSSLPQGPGWEHWPWVRFIRLRPGQDKEDSISLTVPVRPYTEFSHQRGNAEYARGVAIEIGFYDEDLRGLILGIVDLTEQLNCDISLLSTVVAPESQILERFFAGVYIAQIFHDGSFRGFRNKVLSDGDEISMPFMGQLFHGEKVLQNEIDGVSIPYKSNYPPLND